MNGIDIVQGFIQRGYTPYQAAALAGHAVQESGGNPASVNKDEDAHGLFQWRGDRWQGLQDYASSRGRSPSDPEVQMDYVSREMSGPESKSSAGFRNSSDLASASAGLKPYIRFGDNSDQTRLGNSVGLLNQYQGDGGVTTPPPQVGALAPGVAGATGPTSVGGAPLVAAAPGVTPDPTAPGGLVTKALQSFANLGAAPNLTPQLQQINMPRSNAGQSSQIASALAQLYGRG